MRNRTKKLSDMQKIMRSGIKKKEREDNYVRYGKRNYGQLNHRKKTRRVKGSQSDRTGSGYENREGGEKNIPAPPVEESDTNG